MYSTIESSGRTCQHTNPIRNADKMIALQGRVDCQNISFICCFSPCKLIYYISERGSLSTSFFRTRTERRWTRERFSTSSATPYTTGPGSARPCFSRADPSSAGGATTPKGSHPGPSSSSNPTAAWRSAACVSRAARRRRSPNRSAASGSTGPAAVCADSAQRRALPGPWKWWEKSGPWMRSCGKSGKTGSFTSGREAA